MSKATNEAHAFFDSLDPVSIDFMIGGWRGSGYETGHPLDGLLEAYHWHGKRFESSEDVHPLVFNTMSGGFRCVNPGPMGASFGLLESMPSLKSNTMGKIFQFLMPLFGTSKSKARLRMLEYRGKVSATMIYDQLPINDVFRKLDENTVLGVMDRKGTEFPFFFKLTRE